MTLFQRLACSTLGLAVTYEIRALFLTREFGRFLRATVWLAALAAVADPDLTTRLANLLGIGRGADVILYVAVLAGTAATFLLYARQVRLQRRLDSLVSQVALRSPERGAERSDET